VTFRTRALVIAGVALAAGAVTTLVVLGRLSDDPRSSHGVLAVVLGFWMGLIVAFGLAEAASRRLRRRVTLVADVARQLRQGDLSRPLEDQGHDEVGQTAHALTTAARELGTRLADLKRDRARVDAALGSMAEGVALLDAAGRLVLTNPPLRAMLRLPEDWPTRHYRELVRHPDVTAQIATALAGAVPPAVEVDWDTPRRVLVARVVPIDRDRGGGAVLVLHDISDLRQANQVRRDFVANVSHELRTPLTAIRGYVEALLESGTGGDQDREFLAIVARHTLRMERLVHDLLRLARLDAGQETFIRSACAIETLVAEVERGLEGQLRARHQRVQLTMAPDATAVAGDPAKLHDVMRNLIENASNYGQEGRVIEIAATRDDTTIVLTIADRGPGIPPADLPRIFERFYRADRSRTRDPGGTGLGLAIVRHLVELHGGQVSAANRPGGGAVFTLRLAAPTPAATT
jgi:two-component system phosphate regulon sensor histidine kinase PhoR